VKGGDGGAGGKGGTVILRAPGATDGNVYPDTAGGAGGKAGDGTWGDNTGQIGPSGTAGIAGEGGQATLENLSSTSGSGSVPLFPMTLTIEPVPTTATTAPIGGTIVYRATFTNSSHLAIENFSLVSDTLDPRSAAIVGSAGPQGSWDAAAGVFKTAPMTVVPGAAITWEFSVRTTGTYAADTAVINGVTAQGLFNSASELDHAVARLALAAASSGVTFTDDPLTAKTTRVKAIHVAELRQAIDALRAAASLGAYGWGDASLAVGVTRVKATHLGELRTALAEVYAAKSRPLPSYTHQTLAVGSTIAAIDIAELRAAVLAIGN
jgi:uncharacterized repeat protein (TIGR01451 family)